MKSKIKFGLGDNNREIISSTVSFSDDVRDRIAKGFSQGMGYESNLCFLRFMPAEVGETSFEIYPIRNNDGYLELFKDICRVQIVRLKRDLEEYTKYWKEGVDF